MDEGMVAKGKGGGGGGGGGGEDMVDKASLSLR